MKSFSLHPTLPPAKALLDVLETDGDPGRESGSESAPSLLGKPIQTEKAMLLEVALYRIVPNPDNPRREFSEESLQELAEDLKINGVLQPVVARPLALPPKGLHQPLYELVMGERRWRAAKLAGLLTIPMILRVMTDRQAAAAAFSENVKRQDLNPVDKASYYVKLAEKHGFTQTEIGELAGLSQSAIANQLRILQHPPAVQDLLRSGKLNASQGIKLARFAHLPDQVTLQAEKAAEHGTPAARLEKGVPFSSELIAAGFARDLQSYHGLFDKTICKTCPHNAYFLNNANESYTFPVCLCPAHYDELQAAAEASNRERAEGSAAALRERAQAFQTESVRERVERLTRPDSTPAEVSGKTDTSPTGVGTSPTGVGPMSDSSEKESDSESMAEPGEKPLLRISELGYNEFNRLDTHGSIQPESCGEECSCRVMALDWGGKAVPICIDPARYKKLQGETIRRQRQALRDQFTALLTRLEEALSDHGYGGESDLVLRRMMALACWKLLIRVHAPVRKALTQTAEAADLLAPHAGLVQALTMLDYDRKPPHDRVIQQALAAIEPDEVLRLACLGLIQEEAEGQIDGIREVSQSFSLLRFVLGEMPAADTGPTGVGLVSDSGEDTSDSEPPALDISPLTLDCRSCGVSETWADSEDCTWPEEDLCCDCVGNEEGEEE